MNECEACGESPAPHLLPGGAFYVCEACWRERDNYEPPEPQQADGYRPTVQEQQQANRELKR